MLPNPQPSPWVFAPIPYCWNWNVFSKSKLILRWNLHLVTQAQCGCCLGTWKYSKGQFLRSFAERCVFTLSTQYNVCFFAWGTMWSAYFTNSPPTPLCELWAKQSPPVLHICPGFSVGNEYLCWSLSPSLLFKEIHLNALSWLSFSIPAPPPSPTHVLAHWTWCLFP